MKQKEIKYITQLYSFKLEEYTWAKTIGIKIIDDSRFTEYFYSKINRVYSDGFIPRLINVIKEGIVLKEYYG